MEAEAERGPAAAPVSLAPVPAPALAPVLVPACNNNNNNNNVVLSADVGRKNLALCLLRPGDDALGRGDTVLEWALLTVGEPSAKGVLDALQAVRHWRFDEVVIEKQPPKNPSMKRFEAYLEAYAAALGVPVYVQDAKHKLAFAAQTPWWPPGRVEAWTYAARKKLAVQTVAAFLDACPQEPTAGPAFRASKKKDDLADSLLQAMAYAHNVAPMVRVRRAVAQAQPSSQPSSQPGGAARVVARKPTDRQMETYRLTKPGIKYVLRGELARRSPEARVRAVLARLDAEPRLATAVRREFGTAEDAVAQLAPVPRGGAAAAAATGF